MTWYDSLVRVPLRRLAVGAFAAWALVLGVCVWLMVIPAFDARERIDVVGEVQDVRTPVLMKQSVLDFALRGQTVRFRAHATVFKEVFHGRVPPQLKPGSVAHITVDKLEYEQPFSPKPYNVPTVPVEAVVIDGAKILTLDASRQLDGVNRRWAKIVGSMAAVCAVLLTGLVIVRFKRERSLAA